MPNLYWAFLLAAFSLMIAAPAKAATPWCGMDPSSPAAAIFATVDNPRVWREYPDSGAIPLLSDGGETAQVWIGRNGDVLVRTVEPGEDFWRFTDYCFDSRAAAVRLRFQLRTAWGRGYRLEGPVVSEVVQPDHATYFSTQNEKPVPKPAEADDISEALKPTLYATESQLPFVQLLNDVRHRASR